MELKWLSALIWGYLHSNQVKGAGITTTCICAPFFKWQILLIADNVTCIVCSEEKPPPDTAVVLLNNPQRAPLGRKLNFTHSTQLKWQRALYQWQKWIQGKVCLDFSFINAARLFLDCTVCLILNAWVSCALFSATQQRYTASDCVLFGWFL